MWAVEVPEKCSSIGDKELVGWSILVTAIA
jgi:hypothetical protein